ncbi:hypothetical protein BDV95DRAFT_489570, partial [Massariosphaeria phaeospora]
SPSSQDEVSAGATVNVRWRASFGDPDKNGIPKANDSELSWPLEIMDRTRLWQWANRVVEDLAPRRVSIRSICATVYPARQNKKDRAVKVIRRDNQMSFERVKLLAKQIIKSTGYKTHIDFDLILTEDTPPGGASQRAQPRAGAAVRIRPQIATQIQEEGLDQAIQAEVAGDGPVVGIRDRWQCQNASCWNRGYVCWVPQSDVERFENYYPANGHIIATWARECQNG